MSNTFHTKINAERRVLAIVNAITHGDIQFAGLSTAAILAWRQKVANRNMDKIIESLYRIGKLCNCLSDRSHEEFRPVEPEFVAMVDSEIASLLHTINL
jgi:hypothetical protein